jgi:release factor glutamine methyltransferase
MEVLVHQLTVSLTIQDALQQARRDIDDVDARILLQHVLNVGHAHLIAHPEQVLTSEQTRRFQLLVRRRIQGEPVAYLTGQREFYGFEFVVNPAVLIPRPETELLVDLALARIPCRIPYSVLDLGTGSGAIALSIASHRPLASITAIDISAEAVAVARANARQVDVKNVRIIQSNWFEELAGERFDLIVSNPPYIADGDPHLFQGDLRFEPEVALTSGGEGLDCIRSIIASAPVHLTEGGALLLEHGYDQADACRQLLSSAGFVCVFSRPDLADIMRVSGGRLGSFVKEAARMQL